ncbi:hypothetical protein ACNKHO_04785 [Shigella flexneri]
MRLQRLSATHPLAQLPAQASPRVLDADAGRVATAATWRERGRPRHRAGSFRPDVAAGATPGAAVAMFMRISKDIPLSEGGFELVWSNLAVQCSEISTWRGCHRQ